MKIGSLSRVFAAALSAGVLAIPVAARAGGIIVEVEPPAPRVEVVPAAPYEGAVWAPGYWEWRDHRHFWIDGHYEHPRAGYSWRPHGWVRHGHGWRMNPGGWHRH